jgi:hypothetical protein
MCDLSVRVAYRADALLDVIQFAVLLSIRVLQKNTDMEVMMT